MVTTREKKVNYTETDDNSKLISLTILCLAERVTRVFYTMDHWEMLNRKLLWAARKVDGNYPKCDRNTPYLFVGSWRNQSWPKEMWSCG